MIQSTSLPNVTPVRTLDLEAQWALLVSEPLRSWDRDTPDRSHLQEEGQGSLLSPSVSSFGQSWFVSFVINYKYSAFQGSVNQPR